MIVFPNAKINLGLHVVDKRTDGFHNIETLFVPVKGFHDILEVIENHDSSADTFSSSGIPVDLAPENNLVIKALHLLRKNHTVPPLKIHLHKNIPSGAGLGGGSSDAAFMMKLLNEQFNLKIPQDKLEEEAATLGADCAFFIRNKPTMATGIGTVFSKAEISLNGLWISVIIPPVHLSTPEAYKNITPKKPEADLAQIAKQTPENWPNQMINDFEQNAFHQHPQLPEIKKNLYTNGAIYAAMSGSGSAIFGLFREKPDINWADNYRSWTGELREV